VGGAILIKTLIITVLTVSLVTSVTVTDLNFVQKHIKVHQNMAFPEIKLQHFLGGATATHCGQDTHSPSPQHLWPLALDARYATGLVSLQNSIGHSLILVDAFSCGRVRVRRTVAYATQLRNWSFNLCMHRQLS